jgi:hypothetical protein
MEISKLINEMDLEIARLTAVRSILANEHHKRQKKATKKASGKRNLTPEARKKIADAQRRRWAALKKAEK